MPTAGTRIHEHLESEVDVLSPKQWIFWMGLLKSSLGLSASFDTNQSL